MRGMHLKKVRSPSWNLAISISNPQSNEVHYHQTIEAGDNMQLSLLRGSYDLRRGWDSNNIPFWGPTVVFCVDWEGGEGREHPRSVTQRRGWDSNPRWSGWATTVFETAPINHSGTSPSANIITSTLH